LCEFVTDYFITRKPLIPISREKKIPSVRRTTTLLREVISAAFTRTLASRGQLFLPRITDLPTIPLFRSTPLLQLSTVKVREEGAASCNAEVKNC
jgi:hypothetical protein